MMTEIIKTMFKVRRVFTSLTLALMIPLGLIFNFAQAETRLLSVSIPSAVASTLPNFSQRIEQALSRTDLRFEVNTFPTVRSLELLKQGRVALEFFRVPFAMEGIPNIERLEPAVNSLTFTMVTSNQTPEFCEADESKYASMTMAGLRGVRLHELYFYPKFANRQTLNDARSLFKFVSLKRANVSFLPKSIFESASEESREGLMICEQKTKTFLFYGHIHKDFLWAKESVEKALQIEFGN